MALRRFVPAVSARNAASLRAHLPTSGAVELAVTRAATSDCGSSLRPTAARHSRAADSPPLTRETAGAFATDSHTPNPFAKDPSAATASARQTKGAAVGSAELCYDHARQPAPNFWFDMVTERGSGIDVLGATSAASPRLSKTTSVGGGEGFSSATSAAASSQTAEEEAGVVGVGVGRDDSADLAGQHDTLQDFHRSRRFAEARGTVVGAGGRKSFPSSSSTSSSSASSPSSSHHGSSRRLCHTTAPSGSIQYVSVAERMASVLPLSRAPQSSTGYFLM